MPRVVFVQSKLTSSSPGSAAIFFVNPTKLISLQSVLVTLSGNPAKIIRHLQPNTLGTVNWKIVESSSLHDVIDTILSILLFTVYRFFFFLLNRNKEEMRSKLKLPTKLSITNFSIIANYYFWLIISY